MTVPIVKVGVVTHCLVKGSLPEGYEELPICKECAECIDSGYPYYWDEESIIELIDLHNPSKNFYSKADRMENKHTKNLIKHIVSSN